jgi:hypothetical protein
MWHNPAEIITPEYLLRKGISITLLEHICCGKESSSRYWNISAAERNLHHATGTYLLRK